ncbi:hypothetical protein QF032_004925 [Streptomyces achromogenes]|nr:hypothetical protein [Streptomyces achromogenes]
MSVHNGGPAGPPQGPHQPYPPQPPHPHPPQSPQQPRWAWWVVGIVIPVVGILITVLVSRPGSSDGDGKAAPASDGRPSVSPSSSAPAQPPASATPGAGTAQVRYGPADVAADVTNSGSYIELDTSQPVVSGSSVKGADVIFGASLGDPTLFVPGSASNLAPLPASGPAPSAGECAESVDRNGTYTADVKRGDRFCLLTDQGHVAYLRVVTAPSTGQGKLNVTVWDMPAA